MTKNRTIVLFGPEHLCDECAIKLLPDEHCVYLDPRSIRFERSSVIVKPLGYPVEYRLDDPGVWTVGLLCDPFLTSVLRLAPAERSLNGWLPWSVFHDPFVALASSGEACDGNAMDRYFEQASQFFKDGRLYDSYEEHLVEWNGGLAIAAKPGSAGLTFIPGILAQTKYDGVTWSEQFGAWLRSKIDPPAADAPTKKAPTKRKRKKKVVEKKQEEAK